MRNRRISQLDLYPGKIKGGDFTVFVNANTLSTYRATLDQILETTSRTGVLSTDSNLLSINEGNALTYTGRTLHVRTLSSTVINFDQNLPSDFEVNIMNDSNFNVILTSFNQANVFQAVGNVLSGASDRKLFTNAYVYKFGENIFSYGSLTTLPAPVPEVVAPIVNSVFTMNIGTANTNTYNQNLRTLFNAQFPASSGMTTPLDVTFNLLGNIGSTSTSTPALETGSWPNGTIITLVVPAINGGTTNSPANGMIAGRGGDANSSGCCDATFLGQNAPMGGPAIRMTHPLRIINNGIIGSGGQGGHGITMNRDNPTLYRAGGGAGINPGNTSGGIGSVTPATFRFGGTGAVSGGSLGRRNSLNPSLNNATAAIQTNGNALTVTGSGQLLGAITT